VFPQLAAREFARPKHGRPREETWDADDLDMAQGIRPGGFGDVRGLVRMHAGCSEQTIMRRYLTPRPVLTPGLAATQLTPPGGFSVVAERHGEIVGIVTVAPDGEGVAEAGALVADAWQRQGIGTELLIAAARQAGQLFADLTLVVHPSNPAVLPTLHAAGLRARVRQRAGLMQITVPLVGSPVRKGPPGR
jgi:GNAT superfamily N-acetyltransferase